MMDLTFYLRGYNLSTNAMLLYGVLDSLSKVSARNGKTYTYISRKSLAERIGKCERTARKAVKELEACGLIVVKRMGRGYNDHISVNAPRESVNTQNKAPRNTSAFRNEETRGNETAARNDTALNYTKVAALNTNTEILNNVIDKSINPISAKGYTAPKGRPTNKRPRRNIDEQRRLKAKYKELLDKQLKTEELENDIFLPREDVSAVKTGIDLMANAMASKGKIYVNGALLTPYQWWSVVKDISQDGFRRIIYKMPHAKNVKNPRAYFLASVYNEATAEKLEMPFYCESPIDIFANVM